MPQLIKHLETEQSLYLFSDDLVWGCRYYAAQAEQAPHDFERYLATTSCVFMAASVLEAKLNELIANVVGMNSKTTYLPFPFWKVLHETRKDFSYKDKWNLIAAASRGTVWDSGAEPFQSYELIASLRNELIHYKGEVGQSAKPPVKKINALLERFKGPGYVFLAAPTDTHWVTELLSSKELAKWIADAVDDLDMRFDSLLSGKELTEHEKNTYETRKIFQNPFNKSAV
ncbi:MAG: hypothetical protein KF892_23990 [Rhizobacter sp.]|nr:hypothetical protein [Rhizobacter sp.]